MDENLKNYSDIIKKLEKNNLEDSHLISLKDFNNKNKSNSIKRNTKEYINSAFNLALLLKKDNQTDTESWYFWNTKQVKNYKILIPEKIGDYNWEKFSNKIKNSRNNEWNTLSKKFVKSRSEEVKKEMKDYLKKLKEGWKD